MTTRFFEERISFLVIIIIAVIEIVGVALSWIYVSAQAAILISFVPLALVLCFFSLRVVIEDDVLIISYGAGLISSQVPFEVIQSYEVVPNTSWHWLYSSDQDHVLRLILRDGRGVRIGLGDPGKLMEIISSHLRR